MVENVVNICEEVPSERPEGSTVDTTAGEVVPKLINAADDARDMSELSRLMFADSTSGMPEVVKAEEAAVGANVDEITSMLVSVSGITERTPELSVEDFVVLEDSSGPRPPDKEMADTTVGTADVVASGLVGRVDIKPGHEEDVMDSESGAETADDRAPSDGKVPVRVDVQSEGTMTPGVEPPRMETTAGAEAEPGVETEPGLPPRIEKDFA
ncbi:hypothetical protein Daus18300_003898 [Diaporthe australafricana]|uniref:Uncharacterized protein n=1 Tax=Diaporthe australafricana TaxID=127596 RepID=A0ABR3XC60_9PEZI